MIDHDEREPGDVDLFDHALAQTVAHGGRGHVVPIEAVPGAGPVAALLRW